MAKACIILSAFGILFLCTQSQWINKRTTYDKNARYWVADFAQGNYFEGLGFCRFNNMDLVSIPRMEDQMSLNSFLLNAGYRDQKFWTSGNDLGKKGDWIWMSTGFPIGYNNFMDGQPNNFNGSERCLELRNYRGKGFEWNDRDCEQERYFVCENLDAIID